MRIFSAGPNLSNLDVFFVKDAAKRSWYENMNLYHDKCVNIIKKKFKSKRVIYSQVVPELCTYCLKPLASIVVTKLLFRIQLGLEQFRACTI